MSAAPDLAVIEAVRRACVAAGEADPLDEAAVLHLKHHGLDGARLFTDDAGFALERDGDLVLAVSPAARRAGVGGRLLARAMDDAVDSVDSVDSVDRAWSHGDHPGAVRLAARHGWRRTRELWVLRRPTSLALPPLVVPDGVTIRGYRTADADQVLAVNAAAFAHHPEQGGLDAAGLAERMAEPWWDPAGLLVAVSSSDGTLLGFHWTKQHDAALGEVYVVAIGPAAQGRGLGTVLTLAGLHHLAGRGVGEVLLYVESDNAPALHVYTGLGFAHAAADTHVQYTR